MSTDMLARSKHEGFNDLSESAQLIYSLPPVGRDRKLVFMLQCFIDDSGTHDDSAYCVAAGYVCEFMAADELAQSWSELLRGEGLDDFHAKDCFKKWGDFRDWDRARIERFLEKALGFFVDSGSLCIGGVVDMADYREFSPAVQKILTGASHKRKRLDGASGKPYFAPLQLGLRQAALEAKRQDSTVHIIADSSTRFEPYALKIWQEIQEDPSPPLDRVGDFVHGSRKRHPGLQIADLWAHTFYQCVQRKSWHYSWLVERLESLGRWDIRLFNRASVAVYLSAMASSSPTE